MDDVARPGVERLETPERVDLMVDLAGVGSRSLACLLDMLLIAACFLVLGIALLATVSLAGPVALIVAIGGAFALQWGYFVLFEVAWEGQTPGKRAIGLRVRRVGGYPIGWTEALIRNLLRAVDFQLAGAVGLIAMLLNDRHQRIGDLAAGTVVVREGPESLAVLEAMGYGAGEAGVSRAAHGPDLTPQEFETLHDLLQRRDGLQPEAFSRIQAALARGLRTRLEERGGLRDEWRRAPDLDFLEALHASYRGEGP